MAIEQTDFSGDLGTNGQECNIVKKSEETILEFSKGIADSVGKIKRKVNHCTD